MLKVGMSVKYPRQDNLFEELKKAGFDCVETSVPNTCPEQAELQFTTDFKEAKKTFDGFGLKVNSYHLPFNYSTFGGVNLSRESIADKTVDFYKEIISRVSDSGLTNLFVAHSSTDSNKEVTDRTPLIERAKESFYKLADHAYTCGSVVAVEDLPRSCVGRDSNEILAILSVNDKLRCCFDTNHLLSEDPVEFIEKVGNRIVTTHVSDYDFINERHWLPGEGDLDWQKIYNALLKVGYTGPWLYELGLKAPKSIIRERDLTAYDVYNNAVEIMNNKPITTICERIKDLPMYVK